MPRLVNYKQYTLALAFFCGAQLWLGAQNWQPAMSGLYPIQGGYPDFFNIKFKSNLLGKDWIYGTWLDEDSVRRCVAYREGGKWVSLPISFNYGYAMDIEAHGDTVVLVGVFNTFWIDKDTANKNSAGFLKWHQDSLWYDSRIALPFDLTISGDSILVWGTYVDTTFVISQHVLSTDGGKTWQYPYSIVHPTESWGFFGAKPGLKIHNGEIYTLNNGTDPDSAGWRGVIRWDGSQWQPYPYGLWGGFARATALEFYKNQLYMGGTFFQWSHPNNPGNGIVRWDGAKWNDMGGGVGGAVIELFLHDSLLYSYTSSTGFADAPITYFAAWDGHQWCGTPANFARPPLSFGFANDTLFCVFNEQTTTIDNDTVAHMNYFVGNYVNGPNSICSTYGLGEEKFLLPKNQLLVYPNPTSGQFTVQLPNETIHTIQLYDLNGRLVYSEKLKVKPYEFTLDIAHLSAGMYFLHINNVYNAKISKL